MDLAFNSTFIRNLADECDSSDLRLYHCSCSYDTVNKVFSILHHCDLETLDRYDSETKLQIFDAVMYLDISSILSGIAKLPEMLHLVTSTGNADGVRALVEARADVNARDSKLHLAAFLTSDKAIIEELEQGRLLSEGYSQLMTETILGKTKTVKALLDIATRKHCL